MKIICQKNELVKAIGIVSKAVPVRTTMTILECILVDTSSGQIKLTGNDTELGIETVAEGSIVSRGNIALDAKLFSEIVRKLPDGEVTIETDAKQDTTISCGKAVFHIAGKDGDDFTRITMLDKDNPLEISQFTLKEVVRQTIFSISQNDTNKLMTGELFEVKDNALSVVSLDGHRVSIRKMELKHSYDDRRVIVPGKTLQEISKILTGNMDDLVKIYFSSNHIMFEFDQTIVVSRLIEGNYFRVDHMITSDYATKVRINRKEFVESIDRAILMTREDDKRPMVLEMADNTVDISIRSQIGSLDEKIGVQIQGKDLKIGFNPKFVMDALRVIDDEEIDMYFVNSKSPCIIRNGNMSYVYLILPVNFVS